MLLWKIPVRHLQNAALGMHITNTCLEDFFGMFIGNATNFYAHDSVMYLLTYHIFYFHFTCLLQGLGCSCEWPLFLGNDLPEDFLSCG